MSIRRTLVLVGTVAAVAAVPSSALAKGGPIHPTHPAHPTTPGPKAGLPAKAKAYGRYCQGESKTHVAGTPGTPFSTCVTDMAKLAAGKASNPHRVCLNESKTHVASAKGTPYSQCVSGAERLLKAMAKSNAARSAPPTFAGGEVGVNGAVTESVGDLVDATTGWGTPQAPAFVAGRASMP